MHAVRYVSPTKMDCLRIGFPNREAAVAWKEKHDPDGKFKAYVLVPDMISFTGLIILHKD